MQVTGMGADGSPKTPQGPSMEQIDSGYKATLKGSPQWSIYSKPEMVIGGPVPSWQKSVPGPKYSYSTDLIKEKPPVWSMRTKPAMIIGAEVPSWTKSIPGPKYAYNSDVFKTRQPVYSMSGRGRDSEGKTARASSAPPPPVEGVENGYKATTPRPPEWSLKSRTEMVVGGPVPSWVKSIPGPTYSYPTDVYKKKSPVFSLGQKLPTESDLMKVRSPGPVTYGGAAVDAKKQELVDSTKPRSFSCGFGIGSRWEGPTARMAMSGALARYNRPA